MIVGIDLGTTNSLIGIFQNGQARLIPNAHGHLLTPSAVSLNEQGEPIVGLHARERAGHTQGQSVQAFKRWMGTDHSITLGKQRYRAEELSALVLKSLVADAERFTGQAVTEAVITVPAYFNEAQRKATKRAGELAGLKVERLLNEPTAAGLAYSLQSRQDDTTFLIFDLGGGTFDVSILVYFDGIVEVRASAGDTQIGGEDFVAVLCDHFVQTCRSIAATDRALIRQHAGLWRAAEQCKRQLSEQDECTMRFVHGETTHELTITRAEFEKISARLIERLRRPIDRALADARLKTDELAEVILVGGATRMPMIRQLVARLFQRLPLRTINPDETVALGAAIQAGLKARDAALDDVVLTDVMPFTLGIISSEELNGRRLSDRFSPIIERNTPVPVSRYGQYITMNDNQTEILLDIRQGESPIGSDNIKIGELAVKVPPKKKSQVSISVRFSYDVNGLLAVDVSNEADETIASTVVQQRDNGLSPEAMQAALKRLSEIKIHAKDVQENRYQIERAKRLYEDLLGNDRQEIAHALGLFEASLGSQDDREIAQARRALAATLDHFDKGFVV
jgi:molecular chaperone HscC